MDHRYRPFLCSAALLILLPAAALPAAPQQEGPSSLFIDRVDVNVVNVEVFVTDREGRHVAGLGPQDFEVSEDGEPVEISNFYTVARGDRVVRSLAADEAMVEGRTVAEPPPVPRDQQLNLVVYVDHFNLRPEDRNRVLDDLAGFLEDRLTQGDNVMLVGYDRTVDVVQPFTRDRRTIDKALAKMRKAATHRQIDEAERRRTMRLMAQVAASDAQLQGDDVRSSYEYLRSYVQSAREDLRRSTRALESVVRSLAGLPGRKALLYVSDGLPKRPGEELYQHLLDIYGAVNLRSTEQQGTLIDPSLETLREDETQLFQRITREANAHQVTFYTLDARGGSGDGSASAEFADLSSSPGGHATIDNLRTFNLQEPLIDMAETTGGSSILNTFDFAGALDAMAGDFDGFYSLGYRSRRGGDDKYHKIDVKVKRPGLTVRHRAGYVDKPEVERVADRTFSSLILDLEANPLGVEVDFGKPQKQGRGKYLLPMMVRVPVRQLTLLPQGDVHEGRLRIFLIVQDEAGGISDLQRIPYPIKVPGDQLEKARGQEIGYAAKLEIRKGTPKIAVGVWDELSGTESFVHKRVLLDEKMAREMAAGR